MIQYIWSRKIRIKQRRTRYRTSSTKILNYLVLPLNITQSNSRQRIKPTTEHTTITIKVCCIESLRLSAAFYYRKKKEKRKRREAWVTNANANEGWEKKKWKEVVQQKKHEEQGKQEKKRIPCTVQYAYKTCRMLAADLLVGLKVGDPVGLKLLWRIFIPTGVARITLLDTAVDSIPVIIKL